MNPAAAGLMTAVLGFVWAAILWLAFGMTMAALAAGVVGSLGIVMMVLFAESDETSERAPTAEDLE